MFSSIRARLWLSYAALIAVALCVVGLVLVAFLLRDPYLYRQTFVRLTTAQSLLSNGSRAPVRVASGWGAPAGRSVLQFGAHAGRLPGSASGRLSIDDFGCAF